jgi:hypothetical protein
VLHLIADGCFAAVTTTSIDALFCFGSLDSEDLLEGGFGEMLLSQRESSLPYCCSASSLVAWLAASFSEVQACPGIQARESNAGAFVACGGSTPFLGTSGGCTFLLLLELRSLHPSLLLEFR